jgi:hypothetical protein
MTLRLGSEHAGGKVARIRKEVRGLDDRDGEMYKIVHRWQTKRLELLV